MQKVFLSSDQSLKFLLEKILDDFDAYKLNLEYINMFR